MNNTQRSRLNSCHRFQFFNKKYAAQLATIPEYPVEQTAFDDGVAIIEGAGQVQTVTVGATADAAETAKLLMAGTVVKYALRAAVKARQTGNQVLAANLDHPVTYLFKNSKTEAVQRAKGMRDNMNNNLQVLTNIIPANISEMDGVIAVYENIKDMPTIDKQTKAATGTNPLPAALSATFQHMDNMYDLVLSYFATTNPAMVDEAGLARQTIVTGVHHNGVEGTVTKAGQPLVGATIFINGTNKTAITDNDGHYVLAKIKNGAYSITATHVDGSSQTKAATITKANMETVDFGL